MVRVVVIVVTHAQLFRCYRPARSCHTLFYTRPPLQDTGLCLIRASHPNYIYALWSFRFSLNHGFGAFKLFSQERPAISCVGSSELFARIRIASCVVSSSSAFIQPIAYLYTHPPVIIVPTVLCAVLPKYIVLLSPGVLFRRRWKT